MIPIGSTPTIQLELDGDVNLLQAAHVYVTLHNGATDVVKSDDDLTIGQTTIGFDLSQEESLALKFRWTEIQVNWTYADGSRGETEIAAVEMAPTLAPEVLS